MPPVPFSAAAGGALRAPAGAVATKAAAASGPAISAPADTLFLHGSILTGVGLRAARGRGPGADQPEPLERVAALAVRDGLVLATGTDAEMLRLRGPRTTVVDLEGAFAMPGFNDAHTHLALGGRQRLAVDLSGLGSLAELQARLSAFAARKPPGSWLLGGGWDQTLWPGAALPTRADLDAASAGHPALLHRVDAHVAVANSAALRLAGIGRDTPDPPGAHLDRDPATGEPTGLLREQPALDLVLAHVPPPSAAERREALRLALNDALAHGLTSVQDFSDWDDVLALRELEQRGELRLRIAEWLDIHLALDTLREREANLAEGRGAGAKPSRLRLTQLKGFLDGSLGSRTAALLAPYADDPGNTGLPRLVQEPLNALVSGRAAAGFQLGFHAIGDLANGMALDALAAAGPPADRRHRIEHAQVVGPADFQRFADLGVIASVQPAHLLTDMAWAADRLGPGRTPLAYAWRSFLDHGVPLAFGSDYPIESLNPMRGLYAATTRANQGGTATFHPEQRLSLPEALFAATQAPAFAEFEEHRKGRLERGFLADLVVLDRDLLAIAPQALLETRVLRTVVGGETVFLACAPAAPQLA